MYAYLGKTISQLYAWSAKESKGTALITIRVLDQRSSLVYSLLAPLAKIPPIECRWE